MDRLADLNARLGLHDQLRFVEGLGGLPVVEIENAQASASLALQGAHLLTWTPRGQQPVIWLSPDAKFAPGKSVRGGVPVCWPWFGPHPGEPAFPAHGFARTVPWEPVETEVLHDGRTHLVLRLVQTEATRAQWPHACEVVLEVTVGATLEIALLTHNLGESAFTLGQALHTYFAVGDVRRAAVQGLDGCPYLDKVEDFARKQQAGAVTIGAEVDRIYLDSRADCLIEDPVWGRRIRIAKQGSASTVVWNPWIEKAAQMGDLGSEGYLHMLCVESANAAEDVVRLAPGGTHRLWVRYGVEPLG